MKDHAIIELPYGHRVEAITDQLGQRVYRWKGGAADGEVVSVSPPDAVRRLGREFVDREVAQRMGGDLIRERLQQLEVQR